MASLETTTRVVAPMVAAARPALAILDAGVPEGRQEWRDLWNAWPQRDIMAHPDYVRLFARPGDRVLAATCRTPQGGGILYPVIVRPLSAEAWVPRDIQGCDLTTPYGYGGPFAWNVDGKETNQFWDYFEEWATKIGAVSSFARLSLFADQLLPFHGETIDAGPNVIRRVEFPDDLLWAGYRRQAKKSIEIGREGGVTIQFDETGTRLDEFLQVYVSTMDRRKASSGYYFPRSFFENLLADLKGHAVLVHALVRGKVVSTEILLLSATFAYSYLGGTLSDSFALSPNYLLKHESFRWCRDRGLKAVILGGGYQPNDGILRYKQTFTADPPGAFRLGRKTFDPDLSSRLTESRRLWEQGQGRTWAPLPEFFPDYRS